MDEERLTDQDTRRYLARIGAEWPARPDAAALGTLHERHLRAVPFENLSIHLDEPIVLDLGSLREKVVERRRGGFCFELNGLFAALLRGLGFEVSLLAARVFLEDGELGQPGEHLSLRVLIDGEPWLADVGFGRNSLRPVRLDVEAPQHDPDGEFVVRPAGRGDLDLVRDGVPQYRVETRPRRLSDFRALCYYIQYSPESGFTRSPVCTLRTEDGRLTLSGTELISTGTDGQRDERTVPEDELLATYRERFGIELDRVPNVPAPATPS